MKGIAIEESLRTGLHCPHCKKPFDGFLMTAENLYQVFLGLMHLDLLQGKTHRAMTTGIIQNKELIVNGLDTYIDRARKEYKKMTENDANEN